MFEDYPNSSEITRPMRPTLHPLFQKLPDGISEFTFANIYLFRDSHQYRISRLPDKIATEQRDCHSERSEESSFHGSQMLRVAQHDRFLITGCDGEKSFFMLPFGLPGGQKTEDRKQRIDMGETPMLRKLLDELFEKFGSMKCVSQSQSEILNRMGYHVEEDRDNFDYLYSREGLAGLSGRQMHKKKNLLNAFMRTFEGVAKPLLDEYAADAKAVLESWLATRGDAGDYYACKEALELMYELQLCGGIYYVADKPVGFTLGEENALGTSYVIHFEKAVDVDKYKGLYQFINQTFASFLPDKYVTVNREQDLGRPGLRLAKGSYNPVGFVKKYRASMLIS
jgi:hypothetical protein